MAEQSYYRERIAIRHPAASIIGDGPHVVVRSDREVILFADLNEARTAADVSGGQLFFIYKPAAACADFGYRERATA